MYQINKHNFLFINQNEQYEPYEALFVTLWSIRDRLYLVSNFMFIPDKTIKFASIVRIWSENGIVITITLIKHNTKQIWSKSAKTCRFTGSKGKHVKLTLFLKWMCISFELVPTSLFFLVDPSLFLSNSLRTVLILFSKKYSSNFEVFSIITHTALFVYYCVCFESNVPSNWGHLQILFIRWVRWLLISCFAIVIRLISNVSNEWRNLY